MFFTWGPGRGARQNTGSYAREVPEDGFVFGLRPTGQRRESLTRATGRWSLDMVTAAACNATVGLKPPLSERRVVAVGRGTSGFRERSGMPPEADVSLVEAGVITPLGLVVR